MNPPRTIDAYIRVSRVGERAGHESYGSPEDQRQAIERWATYKQVTIAGEHVDEDESGGTQERPGLEAAIARALAGETDGIVAYDISRFSRFTEGGLRDLRRLKEKGARLVFTQEDIDTSTWQGRLTYTVLLAMHEAALEQHKERWKTTKARGIREGRQIGPTPVGYTRARGKHGQLVPHETEGPAITRAYELAALEGLHAAVAHLSGAIPTKTFTVRKQKTADRYGVKVGDSVTVEATWNPATVRRVLAQRVYLGESYYRYADGEELLNRSSHEPLTDLTTFTLAQSSPNGRSPKAIFGLTGHVVCGTCGARMPGSRSGAAPNYRRMHKCVAKDCGRRASVSADALEAYVRELLIPVAAERERAEAPVDMAAATRAESELKVAQERRDAWKHDAGERERLGDAAHAAVLATYDQAVAEAKGRHEEALRSFVGALPGAAEVHEAPAAELGSIMERLGLVAVVQPGRGKLGERVELVSADA